MFHHRTRKTYPGCIKSFNGYPSFGDGDTSLFRTLQIANGIRSSIEPWNAVKKLKPAKIVSKMTALINKFILPSDVVQEKIRAKELYLEQNVEDDIPEEVDIKNWETFLPPLRPVNIGTVAPITGEFEAQLIQDLKRGNKDQDSKINALRSKMIFLALSIEESIQKVVTKNIAQKKQSYQMQLRFHSLKMHAVMIVSITHMNILQIVKKVLTPIMKWLEDCVMF